MQAIPLSMGLHLITISLNHAIHEAHNKDFRDIYYVWTSLVETKGHMIMAGDIKIGPIYTCIDVKYI